MISPISDDLACFIINLNNDGIATNLSFLIFGNISSFVAGLSTVIAGIAIDYGIYVYVAVQRAGRSLETLQQIIRPVTFGALTTISVFAAFFASRVEGYRQMALLANLSILICLFFSLFILPHFVGGHRPVQNDLGHQNRLARMRRPVSDAFRIVIGSVFLLFFIALGHALNITAIIASLVTVGIVSDYGMFVIYYCQNQFRTGTCAAVTLAAITTLIGSAALLFAKHPMLFSVGIVMSTGVLSGFLSSLLVLPPLFIKICRESPLAVSSTAGHE